MLGVTIRDINSKLAEVKNISVQDGVYVEEVTYYAMNLVELSFLAVDDILFNINVNNSEY